MQRNSRFNSILWKIRKSLKSNLCGRTKKPTFCWMQWYYNANVLKKRFSRLKAWFGPFEILANIFFQSTFAIQSWMGFYGQMQLTYAIQLLAKDDAITNRNVCLLIFGVQHLTPNSKHFVITLPNSLELIFQQRIYLLNSIQLLFFFQHKFFLGTNLYLYAAFQLLQRTWLENKRQGIMTR